MNQLYEYIINEDEVELVANLAVPNFLTRLQKRSWSVYRSSTLYALHPLFDPEVPHGATLPPAEEYSFNQASLLQQGLKQLKKHLQLELPGLSLSSSLTNRGGGGVLDGRYEVQSITGWSTMTINRIYPESPGLTAQGLELRLQGRNIPDGSIANRDSSRLTSQLGDLGLTHQSSAETSEFMELEIQLAIISEVALNKPCLVLTKGSPTVCGTLLAWLANTYDARITQFFIAPHQLTQLLTYSLDLILYDRTQAYHSSGESEEVEASSPPPIELKYQFSPDQFSNRELDQLTLTVPWDKLDGLYKLLAKEHDSTSPPKLGNQVIAALNQHFKATTGISLASLALRKFGTPLFIAQCYGKFKMMPGYPTNYYLEILESLFDLSVHL